MLTWRIEVKLYDDDDDDDDDDEYIFYNNDSFSKNLKFENQALLKF